MILLIEDSEDDVFIMRRVLKKLGLDGQFYNAVNGRDALNYLEGKEKYADRASYPLPAFIFLDLKLPFVHGFEVLEWIKQNPALQNVPIAILTSSPERSDRERAAQLGADHFLVKPPDEETLRKLLGQGIPL